MSPPRKPTTPVRRRILAAADRLFRKKGYRTVTLELIATSAHVPDTTFTKHFPTKADLLAALYAEFHAAAFASAAKAPPADPAAELAALPERFRRAAKTHPGTVVAVVEVLVRRSDDADVVADGLLASESAIAELIRAAQVMGMVRRTLDPSTAARDWLRYLFGRELLKPADAATNNDNPPPIADLLFHGLLKIDV